MSAKGKTVEENRAETAAPVAVASQGVRARRAIMMKEFIPHADFIAKEVVGGGKGTQRMLGRVFGFVTGVSEKHGKLPNGDPSVSIVCNGQFEMENYLTGEISSASSVYFPSSFSENIKVMFATDADLKVVEVDTDIGVEATGKTIPYTWVVVNHIEGEAVTPLKLLRNKRGRPASAPALAAPTAQKQLTAS
jgi:hypothetical protein